MRKELEDRFTMFYAVQNAVDTHSAVWTAMVPYANAVTEFKAKIVAIEEEVEAQSTDLEGYAMDKGEKKEAMVRATLAVASKVYAYAEDNANTVLREKVDVSYSDLIAPRDAVVAQKCQGIHDEANAVVASLAPYGVLPADLTALQGLITRYETVISAPRTAITIRKGATENIERLIREGTAILKNRMDKLMVEYQVSNPDFYQEYFDARIVVNTGVVTPEPEPVPPTP
jgi:hypothetical protein